jgi:molecular chaperone HtpG
MVKKNLEIHSENIMPIIKKWLYSDKDIFIRELVSNACDALHKVKILRDRGELQEDREELKVDIKINKTEKTLTFTDTGIGMDADEVQKYIAQIAFSGAEDFVSKYKSNEEKDQFIGHFGLGFYSAYMVAQKVEINTLSYKTGAESVLWSCDGSSEYTLEKGTLEKRGTEITLFLDSESDEFLDEPHLSKILHHYCDYLPYPVYLDGKKINTQEPLWIKSPAECKPEEYLEFYRHLYPMEDDPLFWVHLNVDYPFHLKGILYFPKLRRDIDMNKNTVKLYCNRVFVSDNCKDVIPNYLMVLRGIIDSPDIPLNVSRSYLQMDKTVRQLATHISKKVSDSLSTLYRNDKERFIKSWEDVSMVVKLGILEDDKFYDKVKDILIWKNTDGAWTTVDEYLERNKEKTQNKILYTRDEKHLSQFIEMYQQKGIEVLCTNSPIDPYLIQFIENKISPTKFQRIDAGLDENLLDKSREKTVLDESGKTEAARLADFIRSKLKIENVDVDAKSFAAESIPGFILIDEGQRRLRDYMQSMDPKNGENQKHFFGKRTFVVNTNNWLMANIEKINIVNPELAQDMIMQAYDLALLSQREMDPAAMNDFISRSNRVLENIVKIADLKPK